MKAIGPIWPVRLAIIRVAIEGVRAGHVAQWGQLQPLKCRFWWFFRGIA